ncbi:hypothetical protein [Polymorphospora lycopeni]|uniref:Helix-turn-helix domain-containing protein n=1 Tax=Polymorphospora lycopeni TaxID=3140240 RepID=A0ABV5CL10_9ACTN
MEPRKPVQLNAPTDPFAAFDGLDVADVAKALTGLFGGQWTGWHAGDAGPKDVALWTQLDNIDGRLTVTGVLMLGKASVSGADLRKVPIGAIESAANLGVERGAERARAELAKLPPLQRSGQSQEEWSKLVAQHFTAWAKATPHPAAAMAAEWKVNRQTVNAWIREARLRGLLPPARRGKAGAE